MQQGDLLGPLLFAAALQPLMEELNSCGLDLCAFYLDDGLLCGSTDKVANALALLRGRAAALGLELNFGKCDLICPTATLSEQGLRNPRALFP